MIVYRQLTPEDKPACLPMILELVDAERRSPDSLINPGPSRFYEQFFTPGGALWGAFEDTDLCGFALLGFAELVPALWMPYVAALGADPRDCAILFSTIVGGSHRGSGVGSALYRCRISQARQRGFQHLFGMVHPDNVSSLRLLSKYGFTTLDRLASYETAGPRLLMHKSLTTSESYPTFTNSRVENT